MANLRRTYACWLLILPVLLGACNSGSDSASRDLAAESVNADEAIEIIEAFDTDQLERSIFDLNRVVLQGEGVQDAVAGFLQSQDLTERWAATYVLALRADSAQAGERLLPILNDPEPSLRVIAAGSLIGLGQKEAIPVLIEALDSVVELPFNDPPELASELALEALTAYTGQSFDTVPEWQGWWAEVEDMLEWSGEDYAIP